MASFSGSLALAIGISVAGFFVGSGIKELRRDKETISVKGLSERLVKSNEAQLSLKYAIAAQSVSEFSSAVQKAQEEIQKFVLASGFKENEIQVGGVQMTDQMAMQYGSDKKGPRYIGTGSVLVNTKNVEMAEKTKQAASDLLNKGVPLAGSSLRFYFTDLNSIKAEMLKDATSNARMAAESFAQNAGVSLGKLKSASQGSFEIDEPLSSRAEYDAYGSSSAPSSITKKVRVVVSTEFGTN